MSDTLDREPGFAVVDVETTGLVPARERIVEIAIIRADQNGRVIDEWTTLVNPGGSVGPTDVHGISSDDVRKAPSFREILGEVNERLSGRALVSHNAPFDVAFLELEYARAGWSMPPAPFLCTLEASMFYLPQATRRRLSDCCFEAGIHLEHVHSALGDARATAGLLAHFIRLSVDSAVRTTYLSLIDRARLELWPSVPKREFLPSRRSEVRPSASPAPRGTMSALLDGLPVSEAADAAGGGNVTRYAEFLAQAFEDGVLTEEEARSLGELAKIHGLTRSQVTNIHRSFLLTVAHKAIEDGKVTRNERTDLFLAAEALGVRRDLVTRVLEEAQAGMASQRGISSLPLPPDWQLGDPLRIGDGVAFTGCDDLVRANLEGRAQAAGLRVTGSVSRKTACLVTDGANPNTNKARAAREWGIRVVDPALFAGLLEFVQPAVAKEERNRSSKDGARVALSETASRADLSTVRSWARAQGYEVGLRGRLSEEVVKAFQAAHAE